MIAYGVALQLRVPVRLRAFICAWLDPLLGTQDRS